MRPIAVLTAFLLIPSVLAGCTGEPADRGLGPSCAEQKIATFLDTAPQFGRIDVLDLYGGTRDFDYGLDLIEAGALGWLNCFRWERFHPPLTA